jgi:hypothetical protein
MSFSELELKRIDRTVGELRRRKTRLEHADGSVTPPGAKADLIPSAFSAAGSDNFVERSSNFGSAKLASAPISMRPQRRPAGLSAAWYSPG